MRALYAVLLVAFLLVSGCVMPQQVSQPQPISKPLEVPNASVNNTSSNNVAPNNVVQNNRSNTKLNTTISPARDLTGSWSGLVVFQDNAANPNCKYEGKFDLTLQQSENTVQGAYLITVTKSEKLLKTSLPCLQTGPLQQTTVTGTLSAGLIKLIDGFNNFNGSFTTDQIFLEFLSCPDGRCSDGSAGVGVKGDAKLLRAR